MSLRVLSYSLPADADGKRAQDYLMKRQGYSLRLVRRLKQRRDAVRCDGVPIRMVDRLQAGAVLTVALPADGGDGEMEMPFPAGREVPIVYEDGDVLVYNKPPFLAVHPCRDHQTDTLAGVFLRDMERRGLPHAVFRPVYRLDRDTEGLIVIAKNQLSASLLAGRIQKEYTAVALGRVEPSQGVVDAPIAQMEPHRMKRGVCAGGQRAVTRYEALLYTKRYTLLKLWLETGRTHQIRVHFAHIGHPLAGDSLYGEPLKDASGLSRQALACTMVSFCSPLSGKACEIRINMQHELINLMQNE